jgi:hypothetical protein
MSMLELNAEKARAADNRQLAITETGKYIGTITRAEKLVSQQGTKGLGLSFKTDDGSTANYLDTWYEKKEGEELYGAKTVSALMACLRTRKAEEGQIECEKWDNESRQMVKERVPGYPAMMGQRIGFLLQESLETDQNGKDQKRIGIYGVFQADTELTASEVLDGKTTPEKLPKMLQALMANPVRDNRKNKGTRPASTPHPMMGSSGFGGFDEDIGF